MEIGVDCTKANLRKGRICNGQVTPLAVRRSIAYKGDV